MRKGLRAMAATGVLASVLGAATLLQSPSAAAQEGSGEPALTEATLGLEDMPGGFGETADLFTIGGLITELLARAEGAQVHQHRVFADTGTEVVESLLIGPLTSAEQDEFDAWFADEAEMVQTVAESVPPFGNSGTWAVLGTTGLGDSSFACWITATEEAERPSATAQPAGSPTRLEVALARRGPYLLVVTVTHDGAEEPIADAVDLARLLDRRLADTLGLSVGGFRPPGLLVPDLTTHIPTPTDISTDPAVVGTNLLLAGLAMLAFVVASEVLDNTLAEHEALLQRVVGPARWLGRAQRRLDATLATRLGGGRRLDRARLVGIVAIYGLVFSFLEPGWHPFSVTGLYLFLAMAAACGLVGISADLGKRVAARRLQIPTTLELRPANLIMAMASTGLSRAFSLVPGLLFGRPEALEVDEAALDPPRGARVLGAGALTLTAVGAAAWLLTLPTSLLQRIDLPGWLGGAIGGLEALLLLAFAVAVQNLFLEMLTLPGTAGRYLSRRHRLLWFFALVAAGFAFWHTLVNPRGDLASALQAANVRFFLGVVVAFMAFVVGVRLYVRRKTRPAPSGQEAAPGGDGVAPAAEVGSETVPVAAATAGPPAGWHPDPTGRHQQRYWDGVRWTAWVADDGVTGPDPLRGG
ncbi:MAG TPA: DUF2510 domain-containing protein [Acidimicrobiia bacterium]|nr:DUF2510 domain-containing protein [Acidimicrobiia bacterium]